MHAVSNAPDLARQLAGAPLFEGLPADLCTRIIALAGSRTLGAREFFLHEGDAADEFFLLTSGRVKLIQLTPEGHQVVLRIIGTGEAFGGAGAFGDLSSPVTVKTVEPSTALVWTSAIMRQLLENEPRVTLNAARFIARRLHDLQRRYRQMMTDRVERRIARALLRLGHEAGRRVDAGVEIDFPVSRQDIAEMTGTTLYTVSRILSAWEARGTVRSRRQRVVLTNPNALLALAEDAPA